MDPVLLIPTRPYPAPTWWWDARTLAFENAAEVTSVTDRRSLVQVTPVSGDTGPAMATTGLLGGKAMTFDGDSLTTASALSQSTTALTVAIMASLPHTATGTLFATYDTGANKRMWTILSSSSDKSLTVAISNNGTDIAKQYKTVTSSITDNTAFVFVFVYDASAVAVLKMYLNGEATTAVQQTNEPCASLLAVNPATTIGCRLNSDAVDSPAAATIKHAAIWNRALQPRHIKNINAHWRFAP